ncbi:hypothetical protein P9A10_25395 [Serratia marcescens]|uniref:hypothetical protein n=1 Tax=Serratia marcescens TaxID=615 RepID=UPI003204DB85
MLNAFFLRPMRMLGVALGLVLVAMGVENAGRWLLAVSAWLPSLSLLPLLERQHHWLAIGLLYVALGLSAAGTVVGYAQWIINGVQWIRMRWAQCKRGTYEK